MSPEESINDSCEQILKSIRSSNLNFYSTETPFSMYFTTRKSMAKILHPNKCSPQTRRSDYDDIVKATEAENQQLKKQLSEFEDQIRIIQIKVEGIEVEAAKKIKEIIHCKEITKKKDSEIDILKHVIKNNKSDFDTLNADLKR